MIHIQNEIGCTDGVKSIVSIFCSASLESCVKSNVSTLPSMISRSFPAAASQLNGIEFPSIDRRLAPEALIGNPFRRSVSSPLVPTMRKLLIAELAARNLDRAHFNYQCVVLVTDNRRATPHVHRDVLRQISIDQRDHVIFHFTIARCTRGSETSRRTKAEPCSR